MSTTNTKKITIQKPVAIFISIVAVLGILISNGAFSPAKKEAQAGQVDPKAVLETQKSSIQAQKTELETKLKITDIDQQKLDLETKKLELEKSLEPVKISFEEPKTLKVQEVKVEVDSWQPFIDHAKNNPWKGATFHGKNHLQIALERKPNYENIQGCHPFLLMAIHYTETGLQFNNGANGQGAFQAYSSGIRYEPNSLTTDFDVQAKRACDHIRGKVGGADLSNIQDINLIGKALALYNGCYAPAIGIYAREDFGTPGGWDKCPYTANFLQSNEGMTQCANDGCGLKNQRKIYGTMAFIAHLKIN